MFLFVKNIIMKKKLLKIIGLFLIIIAFVLLLYNSWFETKQEVFDNYNVSDYFENQDIISIPNIENLTIEDDEEEPSQIVNPPIEKEENFIAILEIPKINFKKGLVAKDSKENNVSKNIMIMPISTMPDVEKGNFVLAAHSGIGYLAFFKNLHKLTINDLIYVYYNNEKYIYNLVEIYDEEKNGTVTIYKKLEDTVITLITCKFKDETKQTVYVANLTSKNRY